jgi:hypothetical protein
VSNNDIELTETLGIEETVMNKQDKTLMAEMNEKDKARMA